ncbi:hypothetical protein SNEBB_010276 [Seison nebaliae]|nr:hypothetical protein SNEBB_010276 [Seison nebaliae]
MNYVSFILSFILFSILNEIVLSHGQAQYSHQHPVGYSQPYYPVLSQGQQQAYNPPQYPQNYNGNGQGQLNGQGQFEGEGEIEAEGQVSLGAGIGGGIGLGLGPSGITANAFGNAATRLDAQGRVRARGRGRGSGNVSGLVNNLENIFGGNSILANFFNN